MDMTGFVDPWCNDPCKDTPQAPDFSFLSPTVAEREAYIIAAKVMGKDFAEGIRP